MLQTPLDIALFIGFVILFILFQIVFSYLLISHILFSLHLWRPNKKRWSRECSSKNPAHQQMFAEGCEWAEQHKDCLRELHIVNEKLNLYSEYYDFGYDKAVIVVSGRTEGLKYGYYFAIPYHKSGYNVLCIDQRAHGKSDGHFNTLGFREHRDLIAWAKLLHEQYGVKRIILHGICIGSSCALQALVSKDCPEYLSGLVADGMYPNFAESFKNHMIELKKQVQPTLWLVDRWMRLYTGHTMTVGNIDWIDRYHGPMLFLHSKQDLYSLPRDAVRLYNKCGSVQKTLVWFPEGKHSMLRYTDKQRYDQTICSWLSENIR